MDADIGVQGVAAPPVLYPERELPALIDDSDSDLYDPRLGYQSDTDFENEADERRRVPLLARGARPFSWSSWGHVSSTDVGTESAEDLSRHVCHHLDDVAWMIVTFLRADYEEDFGYDWAILSAVRNKLVHIQNGSGSRGSLEAPTRCSPRLAARRRAQDAFLFRPFACSLQGFAFPCLSLRFLVLHLAQACICTELRRLSASPAFGSTADQAPARSSPVMVALPIPEKQPNLSREACAAGTLSGFSAACNQ